MVSIHMDLCIWRYTWDSIPTEYNGRNMPMSTFEYNVVRAVQIADDILVMILPWLRWLVVSGFSAVFWVLGHRHPP